MGIVTRGGPCLRSNSVVVCSDMGKILAANRTLCYTLWLVFLCSRQPALKAFLMKLMPFQTDFLLQIRAHIKVFKATIGFHDSLPLPHLFHTNGTRHIFNFFIFQEHLFVFGLGNYLISFRSVSVYGIHVHRFVFKYFLFCFMVFLFSLFQSNFLLYRP